MNNANKGKVKNGKSDSRRVEMILGSLKYIRDYPMKYQFVKDEKKRIKYMSAKINETTWRLKSELEVLKDNIANSTIISIK